MALFPCPECGAQISDQAVACPHCGYPVERDRQAAAAQETVTLTSQIPVMTCSYARSYSLFKMYAQMENREDYAAFFGGTAQPASVTVRSERSDLLSVPATAEISATNTILTVEFSLPKEEAKLLTQQAKTLFLQRTLSRSDPLLQPADGTTPRCPRCGSTAVQLVKEDFDLGGAITGGLLFGGAGFVAGALSGSETQRVCVNCGHKF